MTYIPNDRRHFALGLVAIALAVPCAGTPAEATSRFVSPCGQDTWLGLSPVCAAPLGPKRTIQASINSAVDGDVISILPGTYVGAIDLHGKAIHLVGTGGPDVTIVDGNGAPHTVVCDGGEPSDCVLEGLRIVGGDAGAGSGGGVRILFSSPTFIDCQILNNGAALGGGVSVALAAPTFASCVFGGNYADEGGGGVYSVSASPTFVGCEFLSNATATGGGGGLLCEGGSATLEACHVHFNDAGVGGGVAALGGASLTIVDSTIDANEAATTGGGVHLIGADGSIEDTDVLDNLAHTSGGGITVAQGAALSISESTVSGNAVDSPDREPTLAHGGGIRVFGGSLDGSGLLVVGNDAAFGGGVASHASVVALGDSLIWVNAATESTGGLLAEGSSQVTLDDVVVTANAAPLAGGIALDQSTLEMAGGSISNHTSYAASAMSIFEASIHAQGVSIANNATNGLIALGVVTMFSIGEGDATFTSCDFVDNIANLAGGAVYLTDADALFDDCTLTGNGAMQGGAIAADNFYGPNSISLRDCVLHENFAGAYGGALSLNGETHLSALRTRLSFNDAPEDGGAIQSYGADVHLVHCDIYGNTAKSGAGLLLADTSSSVLTGCRITSNDASEDGGALRVGSGVELLLSHCTVSDNTALDGGSALSIADAEVEVANSIVWGNGGVQVKGTGNPPSLPEFRYSIVPTFQDGPGCFTANPQFVNPGVGNYRLAAGSPAIESGNNALVPADALDTDGDGSTDELLPVDRDGDARVQLGASSNGGCGGIAVVDLGAYERDGESPDQVVSSADLNGDGSVDGADLAILLGAWGPIDGCSIADLNADGAVGGADLAILLGSWG